MSSAVSFSFTFSCYFRNSKIISVPLTNDIPVEVTNSIIKEKEMGSICKKKKKKMSMFPSIQNILPEIEEYCHWGRMLNIMELCQ